MADDTTLNAGAGGDTIRTVDRAGKKTQAVLIDIGGGAESLVAAGNPLPVTGTVAAVVNVGLTDAQLRATPVPVSGPLTDTQLRATPVPISGTVTANAGSNLNTSGLLTDTQLRATPVPVSGPLTDVQLRASAVPVSNTNLDVALSTRLKPADTLAALTNLVQLNGQAIAMGTGVRSAGTQRVTIATDDVVPVSDNGASLTVDAPVGTPVFVRLSDGTIALIGQKAMAASLPVVLSSDQTVIPVNGDIDHDVANTLKNIQVGGNASPCDVPPAVVSANGDRVRAWMDRSGAQIVRRRKLRESYTAICRLAQAAGRLDQTFTHTANTNKQWATLHHTGAATKEVRLQACIVWITAMTAVAPQGILELRQISAAPATGNPAITPSRHSRGGTAAEAVCLYLPTTAGTEAGADQPLGHHVFDDAVSVATAAFVHPQGYGRGGIVLYDASLEDDEVMPPVLPVGTLDGWAVVSRTVGATVMRATVMFKFTEEIP